MENEINISIFETSEQLALAAAERFVDYAGDVRGTSTTFSVALAGGNTPRRVFEILATERFQKQVEWPRIHIFFGDERAVPPDHPDSNYRMASETLLSKLPLPVKNVHRINGAGNTDENARAYEDDLRTFFAGLSWPRFDFVFLGMGEDGHTASLFPNSGALKERFRWVVATRNKSAGQDRITLTAPVFNHAKRIVVLVTGKKKAQRLKEVLRPQTGLERLPIQAIVPIAGTLEWLVDRDAAALL